MSRRRPARFWPLLATLLVGLSACASAPPSAYVPNNPKRITWFVDQEGQLGLRKGKAELPVKFDGPGRATLTPAGLVLAVACDPEATTLMLGALAIPFDGQLLSKDRSVSTKFAADFMTLRAALADAINRHNEAAACVEGS